MTYTTAVKKEQLKGIIDIENLTDDNFKVTISSITEEEANDIEFKSLKGIAGRPLDQDEIRKERLWYAPQCRIGLVWNGLYVRQ